MRSSTGIIQSSLEIKGSQYFRSQRGLRYHTFAVVFERAGALAYGGAALEGKGKGVNKCDYREAVLSLSENYD